MSIEGVTMGRRKKTQMKFNRGVYEVYHEGEFMNSFSLEEEAKLYAEVIGSNLNWELVRSLLREKVEEEFGACEVLSLRVEFPYLYMNILAKGVEVQESVRIGEGWFSSEGHLVNCILPHVGRMLGVSFSPVRREEVAKVSAKTRREDSTSLFEEVA